MEIFFQQGFNSIGFLRKPFEEKSCLVDIVIMLNYIKYSFDNIVKMYFFRGRSGICRTFTVSKEKEEDIKMIDKA